jgi:hypothetical protein
MLQTSYFTTCHFLFLRKICTVKRGYSGQRGYSGHFLFYFYFEL